MDSPFRLLDLPTEIRVQIYQEILCYDGIMPEVKRSRRSELEFLDRPSPVLGGISVHQKNPWNRDGDVLRMQLDTVPAAKNGMDDRDRLTIPAAYVLGIMFTCKQIYEEASPIFWSQNSFVFLDITTMEHFLKSIGTGQKNLVRHIGIERFVSSQIDYIFGDAFRRDSTQQTPFNWGHCDINRIAYTTGSHVLRYVWFSKKSLKEPLRVMRVGEILNAVPAE